ncbi:IclR family transcriptional regulator [Sinomonas sp. JGH33]|uniref:IclR family transcriptional regulator n=1 Tax=Sinomonas terricola TaxID=3110330 RepID=A0ABU5TBE6_9MICC|nr:IclR family transcriptional regulator [Sinomonas sp. JGH33]MEA5457022.1 IclR family transcriptional regulator [Sinomonas sp. JGH33]
MVSRVAAILSAFTSETPAMGVSELARRCGLAKSTVSRIVAELIEHGFLERKGNDLILGLRVFELGELAARPRDLRRLAVAVMADLRQATGQTVHMAVLEDAEVVYIAIMHSRTSPRMPSRVGGRMPAFATGVGKALLAFAPMSAVDRVIEKGLWKVGPRTITDGDVLRDELLRIRASGLAIEREESGEGISCAAAPIIGADGTVVAAISISGFSDYLDVSQVGPAVQTAVLGLNRLLKTRPAALPHL